MTEQERKLKEMGDRYSVHKKDDKGRVLVYDRNTDNLTSSGIWVETDGKTKPFNGW